MAEEHDGSPGNDESGQTLPEEVVDRAEQLTRRARKAVDENEATAYRTHRDELLGEYDYRARIREEDDVLVLHPEEWVEEGVAQIDRIEDTDRAFERVLSGPGDEERWDAVEAHNRRLADAVERRHGEVHGANAHALADFMGNHYAKEIERATGDEVGEFLEEYFPRNAWPSEDQKAAVETSLRYIFECAEKRPPVW